MSFRKPRQPFHTSKRRKRHTEDSKKQCSSAIKNKVSIICVEVVSKEEGVLDLGIQRTCALYSVIVIYCKGILRKVWTLLCI